MNFESGKTYSNDNERRVVLIADNEKVVWARPMSQWDHQTSSREEFENWFNEGGPDHSIDRYAR